MDTQDCSLVKEHPKKLNIIDFCKRKIKNKKKCREGIPRITHTEKVKFDSKQ